MIELDVSPFFREIHELLGNSSLNIDQGDLMVSGLNCVEILT